MINPTDLGIGLRPKHYQEILNFQQGSIQSQLRGLNYMEVIVENYLNPQSVGYQKLKTIACSYPIVGHGVTLNLAGSDPLNQDYLDQVKTLVKDFSMPYTSDHLCWSSTGQRQHHDLLPAPYHSSLIPYIAERAAYVQGYLGIPFGIENLSSYLTWTYDEMSEWEFYNRVIQESGCWYMLDINNIYVSSRNHGFKAEDYLKSIEWDRVLQVHLAGHQVLETGMHHDTHDRAVSQGVWDLYCLAWEIGGPFPTLIEWDENIPPLSRVINELSLAQKLRSQIQIRNE